MSRLWWWRNRPRWRVVDTWNSNSVVWTERTKHAAEKFVADTYPTGHIAGRRLRIEKVPHDG